MELEGQPFVRHDGNSGGLTTEPDPAPPSPLALFCKRHTRGYSVTDGKPLCSVHSKEKRKDPLAASLTVSPKLMQVKV